MKSIILVTAAMLAVCHSLPSSAGTVEQAKRIRDFIRLRPAEQFQGPLETINLPISKPLAQGDSDLCWIYSTLSLLETNFMVRHPHDKQILFSRAAMQYDTMEDRFRRWIHGSEHYLEDGGLAVEAIDLIRKKGLIAFDDYHQILDSKPIYAAIRSDLSPLPQAEQLKKLNLDLDQALLPLPRQTHLGAKVISPHELAREVLRGLTWTEFHLSPDGATGFRPSADPDARPETRVFMTTIAVLKAKIHHSLRRGEAVGWGTPEHAMLIYGGQYNHHGEAVTYTVKDTYDPFTYKASAERLEEILTDVTVVDHKLD